MRFIPEVSIVHRSVQNGEDIPMIQIRVGLYHIKFNIVDLPKVIDKLDELYGDLEKDIPDKFKD